MRPITGIRDSDVEDTSGHKLYTPDGMEGVAGCSVCCGFEGSLPSCCPGVEMTSEQSDMVYAGQLDYHRGPMDHTGPAWWRKL